MDPEILPLLEKLFYTEKTGDITEIRSSDLAIGRIFMEDIYTKNKVKVAEKWQEVLSLCLIEFLPIDIHVTNISSVIRSKSELEGHTMTLADSLIAATTIHSNKILVTRNISDFERCGLSLLNPFEIV